ncbi:hypothetical protein J6590_071457 [Homalodisca vitripennis]|nr:hypothetical protein J6590_071457 [Homalodisca vitripennis]
MPLNRARFIEEQFLLSRDSPLDGVRNNKDRICSVLCYAELRDVDETAAVSADETAAVSADESCCFSVELPGQSPEGRRTLVLSNTPKVISFILVTSISGCVKETNLINSTLN